jgi:hypothetical protein
MSKTTPNFDFIKPELSDPADITLTNPNWDKVDEELLNANKVLIAEYDVTPFAEVRDAVNAGKIVVCAYENMYLPLVKATSMAYMFSMYTPNVCYTTMVSELTDWYCEIKENALYTYSTEDLTAGSDPLETGKLYFVYE